MWLEWTNIFFREGVKLKKIKPERCRSVSFKNAKTFLIKSLPKFTTKHLRSFTRDVHEVFLHTVYEALRIFCVNKGFLKKIGLA